VQNHIRILFSANIKTGFESSGTIIETMSAVMLKND
jgi:hypothetical protein